MIKYCYVCEQDAEFSPKGKKCRECNKAYQKEHYLANKDIYYQKSREQKKKEARIKQEWLVAYFIDHPCVDCGESDLLVLEFDHLRDKEYSISRLIQEGSMDRLKKEVAKCEVVCANCHRRRTYTRCDSWRLGAVV